mgnify:CR=1 FL=1
MAVYKLLAGMAFIGVSVLVIAYFPYLRSQIGQQDYLASASQIISDLSARLNFGSILGIKIGDISGIPAELKKIAQSFPSNLQSQIPKIEELVSNQRKEELYLKSPRTFNLPEVKVRNYDQEITAQLDLFEVKDSRRAGGWKLMISSKDLVGEKGNIKAENVRFKVAKDSIEAVEGATSGLIIEEGSTLKIYPAGSDKGKGIFRFSPLITVTIHQGTYSGSYKAEIESSLE